MALEGGLGGGAGPAPPLTFRRCWTSKLPVTRFVNDRPFASVRRARHFTSSGRGTGQDVCFSRDVVERKPLKIRALPS
jgi:hypothetical protein